jgi:large subunit ribosomal protein L10
MFAHYIGMTVADVSELRGALKKSNAEMKVAKKTLMKLATKELNMPEPTDDMLDGAVACIFSFEDPLTGGQVAFKFAKTHKQVELIGGIWEGKLINKEEAMSIAQIPGREALLGMFMAMCQGPLSSFARGLSELAKMKEAPAAEAPKEEPAPEAAPAPAAEAPAAETPAAEAAPTPAPSSTSSEQAPQPAAPSSEAPAEAPQA